MMDTFLIDCEQELIKGYSKKHHPFRYFTLATQGKELKQRTVVLRKLLPDFTVVFFTDARSSKIASIQENESVSALFYHPKKLLQIQISGTAKRISDPLKIKEYWSSVGENAKKDYTTTSAPGSPIKNPDHIEYDFEQNYFSPIEIIPSSIECLQLKRPNHLRVLYTKENEKWTGQFLTP